MIISVFQRPFSWQWYIALTVNWVWRTLTLSSFFFLLVNCSLSCTPTIIQFRVSVCVTQPLSLYRHHLFTAASVVLPLSVSGHDHTAGLHVEFPNCSHNWFFLDNRSYLLQDVTHIRYQYEMTVMSKRLACREIMCNFSFLSFGISPTGFRRISVVPLEFDWTQASPQIPIQSAVPLSLGRCVSLNSVATMAQSSCCVAKIMKSVSELLFVVMAIGISPYLKFLSAASCNGQCRISRP